MEGIKQTRIIVSETEVRRKGKYIKAKKVEVEFIFAGEVYRRIFRERKKSKEQFFIFQNEKCYCDENLERVVEVIEEDKEEAKEDSQEVLTETKENEEKATIDLTCLHDLRAALKARGLGGYEPVLKVYGEDEDLNGDFYLVEKAGDESEAVEFLEYEGPDGSQQTFFAGFHYYDGPLSETLKNVENCKYGLTYSVPTLAGGAK